MDGKHINWHSSGDQRHFVEIGNGLIAILCQGWKPRRLVVYKECVL